MASDLNSSTEAVSMVDVLKEEQQLEEDVTAVLGNGDLHNCTYDMGYINRQALYACLTCMKRDEEEKAGASDVLVCAAGVCLACSYECHEGHNLVELYTKRFFRCDCGNFKFTNKCKLRPGKLNNSDNVYNQNFNGLYCTCHRPYPDPDDAVDDDMIQCIMCEDWFHGRHLGSEIPESDYEEMICTSCISKHSFLLYYATDLTANDSIIDVLKVNDAGDIDDIIKENTADSNAIMKSKTGSEPTTKDEISGPSSSFSNEFEKKQSIATKSNRCILNDLKTKVNKVKPSNTGAQFFPKDWRHKLCTCDECKEMYQSKNISYLLDINDTITEYEKLGKAKQGSSHYQQGMHALSEMHRTQQVEVIHGYNNMKSELSEYLKKFAENGKVVREEDIKEFFTELKNKRPKVQNSGTIQHLCK